ncbi:MAG: DUF3426 domain-containing protein, partial [Pseudohongiellaceae bacterium]
GHEEAAGLMGKDFQADFLDDERLDPVSAEELEAIDHSPVEIETEDLTAKKRRHAFLLTGSTLLLVILAGQYLWFNLDTLARDSRYRPALGYFCRYLGCELTVPSDLSAMVAQELIIRSHPTTTDALEVNFIFRNSASFEQDYPLLELSFSNMDNRLLANRRFTPEEYLPSGLQQLGKMPAQTPVQISLEIVDPGNDAVNYSMIFRMP